MTSPTASATNKLITSPATQRLNSVGRTGLAIFESVFCCNGPTGDASSMSSSLRRTCSRLKLSVRIGHLGCPSVGLPHLGAIADKLVSFLCDEVLHGFRRAAIEVFETGQQVVVVGDQRHDRCDRAWVETKISSPGKGEI
jgi:hypothetical protein